MKTNYLNELKLLLDNYSMSENEKDDIISDYNEMYDNWRDYGMGEEEVEEKLGKPSTIIKELVEGYQTIKHVTHSKRSKKNGKLIAITPFISLVIFFILGFGYEGWTYAWLVFLIIPVSAIFLEMDNEPHKLTALMPFICLITFFILGFVFDLWHPGWLIFIAIPLVAIVTERKSIGFLNTLVSLSPLVALVAVLYIGLEMGMWVPTWTIFLIVPALGVLNIKSKFKILLWEVLIIGGTAAYIYYGYTFDSWNLALLAFIPLVIFGVLQDDEGITKMPKEYRILTLGVIASFFILGFLTGMWGYVWIVFLVIPVFAILKETKGNERVIAITPFIAIVIFFTLGYFLDLWAYSWIAFLIIPVTAIIKEG
ncbi:hypothetical protein KQ51_00711 [Candidatus Izimaplasma bacterium HR1]|jgi:uncharacterized membrane protein|uniref:DUF1700 domain-containing protein n=1 Tax=Candidatus Izimoplasma sp. HR1 TaxID=1541959 RepID=UPI0004F72857|nr:hypothetical protein KQ51_00711 [Candidatus Izimaplasma bacterium HR1]